MSYDQIEILSWNDSLTGTSDRPPIKSGKAWIAQRENLFLIEVTKSPADEKSRPFDKKVLEGISRSIGKWVIARTYSAGVIYGRLDSLVGTYGVVSKARQIYSWSNAFTLIELANNGTTDARLSEELLRPLELTQIISILPMSEKSLERLNGISPHDISDND